MTDYDMPRATGTRKYCADCGALIRRTAAICPQCGAPQADRMLRDRKNRGIAIILALLFGGLGIHKFYLGHIGWGIVYLLFCWTFVPSAVAFIEAIFYAVMGETAFHAKYG